jgi:hypothetical protein
MCKEMPVIPVNEVVDKKSMIGKRWPKQEESHKGSQTQKKNLVSVTCGKDLEVRVVDVERDLGDDEEAGRGQVGGGQVVEEHPLKQDVDTQKNLQEMARVFCVAILSVQYQYVPVCTRPL